MDSVEICRVCVLPENKLLPLDETFVSNFNLLTNLNVIINDEFPQYYCQKCKEIVTEFIFFREKSIKADIYFRSRTNNIFENNEDLLPSIGEGAVLEVKREIHIKIEELNDDNILYEYLENHQSDSDNNIVSVAKESNVLRKSTRQKKSKTSFDYEYITKREEYLRPRKKRTKTKSVNENGISRTSLDDKKEVLEQLTVPVAKNDPKAKSNKSKRKFKKEGKPDVLYCGLCKQSFVDLDSLSQHIETHRSNKSCRICKEEFCRWSELFGHRLLHLPESQKACYLCGKRFIMPNNMEFHYLKVHSDDQEKMVRCKLCARMYRTPIHLKKHINSVHADFKFYCDCCSKGFRNKSTLRQHIIGHIGSRTYDCNVCHRIFKSYTGLQWHKVSVHAPEKTKCSQCNRFFCNHAKYEQHKCGTSKSVVCPVCGLQLGPHARLTRHMQMHSTRRYQCTQCPAALKSAGGLATHLLRHSGVRPHACEFCKATFITRDVLIKHRRVHTGEKPYVCKKCGRGFTGGNNLKVHMRIHGEFLISKRNQEANTDNKVDS